MKKIFVVIVAALLAACTQSPKEVAFAQVQQLGCTFGNGDAFRDFSKKSVDYDYYPKEELKMFTFGEYVAADEGEKTALKQLFKLSARGCYLDAVRKAPGSFK